MQDTRTTRSGPGTKAANGLVLVLGLWLMVSWLLYERNRGFAFDGERHMYVGIIAGAWLMTFAAYQLLSGASRLASTLTVWTGIVLILLPIALRYGYLDRNALAYANHIITGLLVIGAGVYTSKRTTSHE